MKFNKIIIVSIFLLAILTITPLCASDNAATDELSIDDVNSVSTDVKNANEAIGDDEDFDDEIEDEDWEDEDWDDEDLEDEDWEDDTPQKIDLTVKTPKKMYVNNPTTITFKGPDYLWGEKITVTVDGKTYTGEFEDGEATVKIKALKTGTKTISYYADFDDEYAEGTFTLTAVKKPTIQANDLTKYSTETKTYKVRLLDGNNKPLAGKTLKIYINYKFIKSIKTDKKGYASTKIGYSYTGKNMPLKITYDDVAVTKKITVKSVFKSFKTATVKNAKKLNLELSTNKVNGKYLTGKVVTFKTMGKTYKAKINSKGIVKLTLPQKIFSKCSTSDCYYFVDAYLGNDNAWVGIQFSKVKPTLSYKLVTRIKGAA